MTVRQIEPIDRAELRATIQKWIDAHTDVDDTDGVGLLEDVLWEINAQPTLTPQNEWISAEDMLPPNMDDVLVVVRDNGECWTATGYYSSMSKVWYAVLNGQDTQMDVLWWMPFPASPDSRPPEGEET